MPHLSHTGLPYVILRNTALAGGCFALFAAFEHRAGVGLSRYASRRFALDLFYRLVYVLYISALWNPIVSALRAAYPRLDVGLLNRAPLWIALPASWLIFDFLGYWIHRAQHSRYWWPFHRVHHSQEHVTFATGYRNHPLDQLAALSLSLVPGLLLGAPVWAWIPFTLALEVYTAAHHAKLPWRFGWLRWIFVTPLFHQAHHSCDREIQNRNFGGLFSTWDFLFGTAEDARALPERTGVEGWRVPESFWAHLVSPFRRDSVDAADETAAAPVMAAADRSPERDAELV
jgi:sterol desaturase/sphingolipid hydroxylase (fatty acid hydroxylase superfamily)